MSANAWEMFASGLDSWCGKTSREPSLATEERTSDESSKKSSELSSQTPLCLDLRKGLGLGLEPFWATDGRLLGGFMTRSFGESPSVARESRLSQILEEAPHPRYCLSAKACQGILNRAEKRGKNLPPLLKEALVRQANQ